MPQSLQVRHPVAFIQRFALDRLFGGFSHKLRPDSKRAWKQKRLEEGRGVILAGRSQVFCER
jgi:hypothetical protein